MKIPLYRQGGLKNEELIALFMEYFTDMTFILATLIGGIVAISYVFIRKGKRAR
jgi:hypothetical protein